MHPIVLLEAPGTGYWEKWLDLVAMLEEQGMIAPDDRNLFTYTTDVDEACREILSFYDNYHSQRYVNGKLILRLKHNPDDQLIEEINDDFADILVSGRIEKISATPAEVADDDEVDLPRVQLHFDRRHLGRLRGLVDRLNAAATEVRRSQGP